MKRFQGYLAKNIERLSSQSDLSKLAANVQSRQVHSSSSHPGKILSATPILFLFSILRTGPLPKMVILAEVQ
jgi:hypothetical protein